MCTGTCTFSRAHSVALGTVQIMIGLMVFSCDVIVAMKALRLTVYRFFFVWGAGICITAGSLTVAAGKSYNRCLMNTTLAFNVIATVAAFTATCLYALEAVGRTIFCAFAHESPCHEMHVVIFLAVILFLEFIISIVVSVFIRKSTCSCCNEQPSGYIIPGNASLDPLAPPSYPAPTAVVQVPLQMKDVSNPADEQNSPGLIDPPPYSKEEF